MKKFIYATVLTIIGLAVYVIFSMFFFNILLENSNLKTPVRTSSDIVWGEE